MVYSQCKHGFKKNARLSVICLHLSKTSLYFQFTEYVYRKLFALQNYTYVIMFQINYTFKTYVGLVLAVVLFN